MAPPYQRALSDFHLIFGVFSRINVHAELFHLLLEGNPESLCQLRPPPVSDLYLRSCGGWCRVDPCAENTQIRCSEKYQNAGFITFKYNFFLTLIFLRQCSSCRADGLLFILASAALSDARSMQMCIKISVQWRRDITKQAVCVGTGLCNYQMNCHYRPRVVFYCTCHNRREKNSTTTVLRPEVWCFPALGVFVSKFPLPGV